jgi:hypothetical protein
MFEYKTEPFAHQRRLFEETRDIESFAVLWEQGTGKTKPTIDTAAHLYLTDKIDALLVVSPNGVHRNWITDELPVHMPDAVASKMKTMHWRTIKASTKYHQAELKALLEHKGLAVFCLSYQGFMTEKGKAAVWRFLKRRRVMYVLDESHEVKTPKAKRTRAIIASGKYAPYRRILTGTPGDKPFDLYSQLRFLHPTIWRDRDMDSFFAFKQHFGEWFTRSQHEELHGYDPGYDKLIDFKNLDELNAILASVSDRVLKEDVLDLPPKLYTKRYFEMTPKQRKMYDQVRDDFYLELEDGRELDASMAIVRLLRLQQITCGYVMTDADEPVEMCDTKNPRLDATLGFLQELNHPGIVWARFRKDVDQLMDALGPEAVRYDGALDDDEAERSKLAFNAGDAKYFVGNPAKGSTGLTLNAAKTTTYYSNSFKLLERLQTEDRNHRIGQDGADHGDEGFGVLYADVCCGGTVDDHIVKALRKKFDVAAQLTGDNLREWL